MAGGSASNNLTANSGGKFYVSVSWTETGTSVANNTSTISITGTLGQRAAGEAFWSGNIKAGQLIIYWHDSKDDADVWVNSLNIWEIGYDLPARSVTGSITVTHNADGTLSGYAKAYWVKDEAGTPYYAPNSGWTNTGWTPLTTIPRASTPTINPNTISLPAVGAETFKITTNRASSTFTHDITIKAGATTVKTLSGVGESVEVPVSDIDTAVLATIPNATTTTLTVTCVTKSGNTTIGTKNVNMTANVSNNAAPTFSNFTYVDTNGTTTAVTGDSSVMISGKSSLSVTISSANKATANYSATMDKYTFAISGLYSDEAYSASSITKALGAPTVDANELPSATRDLTVSAIDSRGLSTAVAKAVTIVPYQAPIVNATAKRVNGFENDTTISIAGTFSRIEVNGTAKNTVNSSTGVRYRYKAQSSSTWGSWTNKTATVDTATGSITVANFTLNLNNQASYDIQIQITDKLETTTANLVVSVGQPAFYIGTDGRVSIGGMPTKSKAAGEDGLLEVVGKIFAKNIYPVGSIYMSTTMTTASQVEATLGGTWVAWGSGRVPVGVDTSQTEFDTVEETGGEKTHQLTTSELPAHNHPLQYALLGTGGGVNSIYGATFSASANGGVYTRDTTPSSTGEVRWGIGNRGSGSSHNNLQPYITCYMYKRTA